jgi:hypothetical protein
MKQLLTIFAVTLLTIVANANPADVAPSNDQYQLSTVNGVTVLQKETATLPQIALVEVHQSGGDVHAATHVYLTIYKGGEVFTVEGNYPIHESNKIKSSKYDAKTQTVEVTIDAINGDAGKPMTFSYRIFLADALKEAATAKTNDDVTQYLLKSTIGVQEKQ